jgi:hypothetical protein
MTPQEISDYKLKWRANGVAVPLHSDLDVAGKDWCRRNLERHQWAFNPHTAVYAHTFLFEDAAKNKLLEIVVGADRPDHPISELFAKVA